MYTPPETFTYYYNETATFVRNHTNRTQYWYSWFNVEKQRKEEIPLTKGNINYILKNIKQKDYATK
jgi:hypothetical protein